MSKFLYVGLIAALVLSVFPSTVHANLLDNSGFENWVMYDSDSNPATPEIEVPADWMHIFSFSSPTGTKESTTVKSGTYSGKIAVTNSSVNYWGGWFQEKPFTAGNTLYAYQPVNIPSALTKTIATLQIQFKDASDTVLYTTDVERTTATSGWESLSWNVAAPFGTTKLSYGVMMESWGSAPYAGTVYFDDAYADNVPIPEPASMLLLGSGLIGMLAVTRRKK